MYGILVWLGLRLRCRAGVPDSKITNPTIVIILLICFILLTFEYLSIVGKYCITLKKMITAIRTLRPFLGTPGTKDHYPIAQHFN